MNSKIEDEFEQKTDRELAVEMDLPEEKIKQKRKESGFLRLEEFTDSESATSSVDIKLKLEEMEKRKLQGFLGEKLTSLMKSRVVKHLDEHLKDSWILRDKLHLVNLDSRFERYWASGRPYQGEIRINGRTIKHQGSSKDELEQHVKERTAAAEENLFKKFREIRNPFIDFSFYAIKTSENKKVEFNVEDYSNNGFDSSEKLRVETPVIDDFKIVMLEVKTTKDEAEQLFSSNQRKARDLARGSPFLDFFSLKVNRDFEELDIPEDFSIKLKKHS